jgi:hypothetical protein
MSTDDSTDDAELVEPGGQGADLFDVPTTFFLTHREQIERWYALKARAAEAVHEYLLTFHDELEAVAAEEDLELRLFETGRQRWNLLLWPPDMALDAKGEPPIAVGLRWHRIDTVIEEEARAPRVGVRVGRAGRNDVWERFLSSGQPSTRQLRDQEGYRSDRIWPVFRNVPSTPHWWADLDGYRAQVAQELTEVVRLFGDRMRASNPGS